MSEKRVFNFSAGPSCLPEDVLKECAAEMLNYNGTGQSVMEMSHRSSAFKPIIEHAEAQVRKLMNVPDNYKVLFLQGGGSTQFAMVAENLAVNTGKAAYIETGGWAKKAAAEAGKEAPGMMKAIIRTATTNFNAFSGPIIRHSADEYRKHMRLKKGYKP